MAAFVYGDDGLRRISLEDGRQGTVEVAIDLGDGIGSWLVFGIDSTYVVVVTVAGAALARWDGQEYAVFEHRAIAPAIEHGHVTFTLTLADLGGSSFGFWVASRRGADVELSPARGTFTYPPEA